MNGSRWPTVALEDVAPLVRRIVTVDLQRNYTEIGVRSFFRGTFHRRTVRGSEFTWQELFAVREGDLVFSNLMAWEGAVAVATAEDAGCVGNHRMLTCEVDPTRAVPRFLYFYFRQPAGSAQLVAASPSSIARNRTLGPAALADLRIPLPSLAEQKRIVARLDGAADRIAKRAAAAKKVEVELGAMLQAAFRKLAGHRRVRLSEVMILRPTDTAVMPDEIYQFAGVYSFGRGVFRSVAKRGSETAYQRLTRLRQGNFVYPKLMAWEGALGIVPPICDGCFVSPEFPVFEIDQDAVLPELLELHFRDRANWPKSTGTNVRRKRVHPEEFLRLEMPLPPLKQQEALAEACRKAALALAAQRDAAEELDKLLPALLHEAFGEGTAARPRAAA